MDKDSETIINAKCTKEFVNVYVDGQLFCSSEVKKNEDGENDYEEAYGNYHFLIGEYEKNGYEKLKEVSYRYTVLFKEDEQKAVCVSAVEGGEVEIFLASALKLMQTKICVNQEENVC